MTKSASEGSRPVALGPGAVTGAIGDSITVIPLVVALALLTDVSLPHALVVAGVPIPRLPGAPPTPAFGAALTRATLDGVVAQLAMTIGNAALATSLLFADLLNAEVTPDELSTSMGITNLIAVPLGGIPMCHGCDGVAGKYAFGARTGGANVVLGAGYLATALFATPALIAAFPLAMLGALLAVVAVSLARNVTDSGNRALSVGIGLLALATNLGVAFVVGIAVHLAWERMV